MITHRLNTGVKKAGLPTLTPRTVIFSTTAEAETESPKELINKVPF